MCFKPPYWISRLCGSCSNSEENKAVRLFRLEFVQHERERSFLYISNKHTWNNKETAEVNDLRENPLLAVENVTPGPDHVISRGLRFSYPVFSPSTNLRFLTYKIVFEASAGER